MSEHKKMNKALRKRVKRLNRQLRRCPFCGGKAKLVYMDLDSIEPDYKVWGVWCKRDQKAEYGQGHMVENCGTPEEAVDVWNGVRRRKCRIVRPQYFNDVCSECSEPLGGIETLNYCPKCGAEVVDG